MEQLIFFVILGVSCLIAGLRGGPPERIAAFLLGLAAVLSTLLAGRNGAAFSHTEWELFGVDFALLVALVALALTADRYWPMWLSSLQFVSVWMHPAFGLTESKMAYAYAVANIIWSYPMLLILVLGALRHHNRLRARALTP